MTDVGLPAPDVSVEGPGGEPTRLSSLWPSGPTILIFLRHFG